MALRPPTHADIRDLGAQLHLDLTEEEVADFRELVADSLDVYESVRDCGQPENPYTPGRDLDAGHRVRDGDPYNAWITRCDVGPTGSGPLAAVSGEGLGHNWKGWYNLSWLQAFGKFRRTRGGDFPPTVKLALLTGGYTSEQYHSRFYAEAMNLRAELTERHQALLDTYDLIAMPTAPQTAQKHEPDLDRIAFVERAWTSLTNVSTANMTGQPALSVPVASKMQRYSTPGTP